MTFEQLRPLCFVLMPFGVKKDPATLAEINFDAVYNDAIRPAIEAAELTAVRADEERVGGIIHKPMFERLLLCDFAIADLTMSNANVFYELGVRHATRPQTTLAIFAEGQRLPFDIGYLRAIPYRLGEGNRFGADEASALQASLTQRLVALRADLGRKPAVDSPLFQLLTDFKAPEIAHLKTDVFQQRVEYSSELKERLANLRSQKDAQAVAHLQSELEPLDAQEPGVVVDLFLTWRALSEWQRMVDLFDKLSYELKRAVLMREQLGFALNRLGRRDEALSVLDDVLKEQGPSSETLGLIGRIYKDRWLEAQRSKEDFAARGFLARAIDAYLNGFRADPRDAYPGINAVTLLDIAGDERSLKTKNELVPVVRFAVRQRLGAKPNYWDHATLLELAVLDNDSSAATQSIGDALATRPEGWMKETTANNIKLIQAARQARGAAETWLAEVIAALEPKGGGAS